MRRVEQVMGFPVSLRIDDENTSEKTADPVFAWLREVDARFSPFRADSEVSRLDRGELTPTSSARTWPRSSVCARSTGSRPAARSTCGCPAAAWTPARW